jgi:hypothetical protein
VVEQIRPEFIRLPKPKTRCPYTGMSRSELYALTIPCAANDNRPPVPAKNRRKPGNLRGVWLIPYGALISYLHALPTPGMKEGAQ